MVKKFRKDVTNLSGGLLSLSLGAALGAKLNTKQQSFDATRGIAVASSFAPVLVTGIGASAALRQVRKLNKRNKINNFY